MGLEPARRVFSPLRWRSAVVRVATASCELGNKATLPGNFVLAYYVFISNTRFM